MGQAVWLRSPGRQHIPEAWSEDKGAYLYILKHLTCADGHIVQLRNRNLREDYSGDVVIYLWDNYISCVAFSIINTSLTTAH